MESDCKSQFMSGCFRVNELVIGGSRVKVQAGAHLPLFTGNSEAMLHLISVSASCLTCVEELSSGTHRQRLGRSPAPPPVGSQMTVFRLDCRANEVEQLHVPSNAHSSLPPHPPKSLDQAHLQSHNAFPNYSIVSWIFETVLQISFYKWFNELPLLQGSQIGTLWDLLYWRSRLIFRRPPGLNYFF